MVTAERCPDPCWLDGDLFLHILVSGVCRDLKARAEKEQEQERTAYKERARRTRASLEHPDSDAEEDPWERKPIATR